MFLKSFKKFSTKFQVTEEFFNRKKEKTNIINTLNSSPQLTIISGGNDTGKSALINNVLFNEIPQNKLCLIHVNFRDSLCNTVHNLTYSLVKSIPQSFYQKIGEAFPNHSVKSLSTILGTVEFHEKQEKKYTIEDLEKTLASIQSAIPSSSLWNGKLIPVLFIDEANKLKNLDKTDLGRHALEHFIDWIVKYTKETPKFHILLATSDSFFVHYMRTMTAERCEYMTIGDLDYDEARKYFDFICESSPQHQDLLKKLDFKNDIYDYVGGRLFLIKKAVNNYINNGNKCANSTMLYTRFSKYKEALNSKNGSYGKVNFKNLVAWENKTLRKYMTLVAENGFANFDDNDIEVNELLSMVESNLFNYRITPPTNEDIIGLKENEYPVLISPSALDYYVIKKMVKNNFEFKGLV
jgi:AAA+ ATPase superfamily predicted ATPase